MATFLFANNASTTLAGTLTTGATTATLASGTGALFPSPSAGQQFAMTFTDASTGIINEIVYVTARSSDTVTIVRAQEGTTAKAWAIGDNAANLWTKGSAEALVQAAVAQNGSLNYAADSGTDNAVVVALSPAPASLIAGFTVRVKKIASQNTGAVTMNVNGLGAKAVVSATGAALVQGILPASGVFTATYDGTSFQIQSGVPTILTGVCAEYASPTPPANALIRDGSAISRTGYPGLNALAAAASYADPWGPGDGSTTFNLPNDGGLFPRWWVSGQAIDPGRGFGSYQADKVGPVPIVNWPTVSVTPSNIPTYIVSGVGGTVQNYNGTIPTGNTETAVKSRAYLPIIFI